MLPESTSLPGWGFECLVPSLWGCFVDCSGGGGARLVDSGLWELAVEDCTRRGHCPHSLLSTV